jgi:hypothetical protein
LRFGTLNALLNQKFGLKPIMALSYRSGSGFLLEPWR